MRPLAIGVQLISRGTGDPATRPFPAHTVMLEDGIGVERLGFDAVWLPDHFYFDRDGRLSTYPEVWTLLTALAVKTERVTIGTNVLAAGFRHPALLAKMAGAVQELAGGRLILGLGAGNQIREHTAFGFDFEHRIGRFKEYMPILKQLLDGETVTVEGRYYTLREASLRTVVPAVPIWIAAGGPQMFDLTVQYASGWNIAGGGADHAQLEQRIQAFAAACRARRTSIDQFDLGKQTFLAVAPDAGAVTRITQELADRGGITPEALAARTVVGTPDAIVDELRALTCLGINHHILNVAESSAWPDYADALEVLSREVLPRVRQG